MPRYTLILNEGQLRILRNLAAAGVHALQMDIVNGAKSDDPILDADTRIDAFSRGPRLVAILDEHLAMGPEPAMEN